MALDESREAQRLIEQAQTLIEQAQDYTSGFNWYDWYQLPAILAKAERHAGADPELLEKVRALKRIFEDRRASVIDQILAEVEERFQRRQADIEPVDYLLRQLEELAVGNDRNLERIYLLKRRLDYYQIERFEYEQLEHNLIQQWQKGHAELGTTTDRPRFQTIAEYFLAAVHDAENAVARYPESYLLRSLLERAEAESARATETVELSMTSMKIGELDELLRVLKDMESSNSARNVTVEDGAGQTRTIPIDEAIRLTQQRMSGSSPESAQGQTDGERVAFTHFYPAIVPVDLGAELHVYIHLASMLQEVRNDFERRNNFRSPTMTLTETPGSFFKRSTVFTIIPTIGNAKVKPNRVDIQWEDDIEHLQFDIRLGTNTMPNTGFRGEVRIYVGTLIVGQLPILFTSGDILGGDVSYRYKEASSLRFRKLFVSYSHEDEAVVRAIDQLYRKHPEIETYIDYKFLQAADYWWDRVQEKIREAEAMQLFWSPKSSQSDNVTREWRYALSLPRPIIPIILEPRPAIPEELKDIHFQDFDSFVSTL